MEIIYKDADIVVAIKPPRVLSTDEPGGMPELVRNALCDPDADVRTVHRLDRVVSGLMVLARNPESASELSRQIREDIFCKEYLAVLHGTPDEETATLRDLLLRDKRERKTYIVDTPAKGVQEAILDYTVVGKADGFSKVTIVLRTGRTHQIRAQFSGRNLPIAGDRKYSLLEDDCEIALWSARLKFHHPKTGELLDFYRNPPDVFPWSLF